MCELFGMSARLPTTVRLSLERFARHGGAEGPHKDGWGIAYYEDGDALLLREAQSASSSGFARFVEDYEMHSELVISHIRKATQGGIALRNTQPFAREMAAHRHIFAHNGELPGIEQVGCFHLERFFPVGDTDSEYAFCSLMERMRKLWQGHGDAPGPIPSLQARLDVVRQFAEDISPLGQANFLYSDGYVLFAHSHIRRQDSGEISAPGLHLLCRVCDGRPSQHGKQSKLTGLELGPGVSGRPNRIEKQAAALVASVPLSDERWRPLPEGEVIALSKGRLIARANAQPT
ncbi:class II glutamine amidotransferase [Magnetofaba australis]|uniref:Putative glutamine amidotransferase, class-II n=1 Tax=Magnetofaba australis IT-1 TaxID=1434232 RepID=A0A1Y2K4G1_9PROT|nr:class II glutamine amidotransferase [Magnetofaba australis]OSM04230.1 putative glutamine amidotransferase, class-II [Magnetofaba australis IT-1]